MGGQPRISERKSWRAPIVTEQGNLGIYVQIDEWLPLYKGNVYVVDEITGRMYLSKGGHLMRIAETASHHPFQDHELSISRHVPEKEYTEPISLSGGEKIEVDQRKGELDPITPVVGATGGTGRTPIPVAESTNQPEKEMFTPGDKSKYEGPGDRGGPMELRQERGESAERDIGLQSRGETEWVLPKPSEPRKPPVVNTTEREMPSCPIDKPEREFPRQEYPTPEQRLVEADKRHRRKLAALARDHIVKLREERYGLAQGWLEEYSMQAASAKLHGHGLGTLRAEYIHRYNRLLDRKKQPHCDFFFNLSLEAEGELDFEEEEPFDLSDYDQHFEWDEAEYMKLRFIAARHYASRGHWDDAYVEYWID